MNSHGHKAAPACHTHPHPAAAQDHACCATHSTQESGHAAHAHHATGSGWKAASSVTLHCLTGCAIGEWIGLAIGISLDLPVGVTVLLAVVLSFASGFALTLAPLMRRGMRLAQAMRIVWIGEAVSISVMELVMNLIDYHMGGMRGVSLASGQYWTAFAAALVGGYLAAIPVNYWLLRRNLKNCH